MKISPLSHKELLENKGKERGADLFSLANYIYTGKPCDDTILFEKDGVGYTQSGKWIKNIAFNSNLAYLKCNWLECFCKFVPDYDTASMENVVNFLHYHSSFSSIYNTKPGDDELYNRCNEYFQKLTGDNTVGFSLGNNSFIYYNEDGLKHIEYYHKID